MISLRLDIPYTSTVEQLEHRHHHLVLVLVLVPLFLVLVLVLVLLVALMPSLQFMPMEL